MIKTGKHGYLDEIFESKNQYEQFKETIYDVNIYIVNLLNEGKKEMPTMLWKKHIPNMINEISEFKKQPSTCAFHDALDEKITRQIKDLRCLLKILEKLELDFIFI